jgi:hypothetical protein
VMTVVAVSVVMAVLLGFLGAHFDDMPVRHARSALHTIPP